MLLSEMQSELYDHFGYGSSPASAVVTRLLRNLNIAYRELMTGRGMSHLRRAILTFDSVANQPYAVLPQAASRILTIQDRTNTRRLTKRTLEDLRYGDPGLSSSSSVPYEYVIENLSSPVARDPSNASELFVDSTSAGDTQSTYFSGIITGGYERSVTATLTGTTAVTLSAAITSWLFAKKWNLASVAVGTVTLHEDSGAGTELARIPIGKASARHSRLLLYPTPSAVVTYHADVELLVESLDNPFDEPILPVDYHWLVPCGAMMREYQKREKHTEYSIEKARWKEGSSALRSYVQRIAMPDQRQGEGQRFSQLGPWFSE